MDKFSLNVRPEESAKSLIWSPMGHLAVVKLRKATSHATGDVLHAGEDGPVRVTLLRTHAVHVAWASHAPVAPGTALWRHAPQSECDAAIEALSNLSPIERVVLRVAQRGAHDAACRSAASLEDALLGELRVAHLGTPVTFTLGGVPMDAVPTEVFSAIGDIDYGVLVPGTTVEVAAPAAPKGSLRKRARISDGTCCALFAQAECPRGAVIVHGHVLRACPGKDVAPGTVVLPSVVDAAPQSWVDVEVCAGSAVCGVKHALEKQTHDSALLSFLSSCRAGLLIGPPQCGKSTALRAIAQDVLAPVSLIVCECEGGTLDSVHDAVRSAAERGPGVVLALDHVDSLFPSSSTLESQPEDSPLALKTCLDGHALKRTISAALHWGVSTAMAAADPDRLPPAIHEVIDKTYALQDVRPSQQTQSLSALPTWESLSISASVKERLVEALLWPVEHADWFDANAALRRPRGVLLAGPPGSGKTLLARVLVASRVPRGVHVAAVAGPEVLRRYVGASEAALRALFADARRRAPSIIVIDEADAVLRRRGAGGEGVGDRLVNQMLTEVDAAPRGVAVLLLSARPESIDPAVLRPGRVDCHIFLGGVCGSGALGKNAHDVHSRRDITPSADPAIGGLVTTHTSRSGQKATLM